MLRKPIIDMIRYTKGDILESSATALVNTVNLVGVMGKGIALQFKNLFPDNNKQYQAACKSGNIGIGKLFVTRQSTIFGEKLIINFPTKDDWRKPSEYAYIQAGLEDLIRVIDQYHITSIAIPPLGAGNGGLNWVRVREMIEQAMANVNAEVIVYEPNAQIVEKMKAERAPLTKARALLLYVLYDLVRNGEFVSEFSSEKVCYFLQRFGAQHLFKLSYTPQYYGPYSGKVRYVLYAMNGSYIMGYSAMDKKPFEALSLVADAYPAVKQMVESDDELRPIAEKTTSFLNGYYSDFALELLSSVDYIMNQYGELSAEDIYAHLSQWNHRKSVLFSNRKYIESAKAHLTTNIKYNKNN